MTRSWGVPLLAALLGTTSTFACTFGANDYKVVPALASGGSGGSGGSDTVTEGGAAGDNAGCVNHTPNPLVVFSADDLYQMSVDRFLVVAGVTEVFAVAFVTVPNGPVMQTHAIIRAIGDANFGTVRGIADMMMPSTFVFGGAWATATEIDIVGADQRGIVQLTIPVNALGNPDLSSKTNLVVTPLDTPVDCATTVRALRVVKSATGAPSYVASCEPDPTQPTSYSLWLSTPALTKTIQVGTTAIDSDNLVRSFVRNGPSGATSNLIMVGIDESASSDFRTGNGQADLKTVNALTMTTDTGWLQETLVEGLPVADGGTFMTVTKSHNQAAGYVPVEVWAGAIASNAYSSLTVVPPAQLNQVATFTTVAEAFFPQEWTYRGSSEYVVAEDEYVQHNLQIWTLDSTGTQVAPSFPVYSSDETGNVLTDARISPLTFADIVAWVETSPISGTAVYADSVTCP